MTAQNPGAQARLHLLDANRDALAVMLARAVTGGLSREDAVIVVVDQRDPVGRQLAEAAAQRAGLNGADEAQQVEGRGKIPTAILVIPVEAARLLFGGTHPELAAGLTRSPAPRRVRVVVVAEGAAMLVHAEVSLASEAAAHRC